MNVETVQTKTYKLTDLDALDPVTVYVTNVAPGKGKIVIECYGQAWSNYWGAMSDRTIEQFVIDANNEYLIEKLIRGKETETDYTRINEIADKEGFCICVSSDVEIAMQSDDMQTIFGPDWYLDLPQTTTREYRYLERILNAVRECFELEINRAA